MRRTLIFVFLILTVLWLSACGLKDTHLPTGPDQPVSSNDTPIPTIQTGQGEVEMGEKAVVEEMGILFLESFPLQVHVTIKGYLPDGCTTIDETLAERTDETIFEIKLVTVRPKDAMCTQALAPFEVTVPLDVYGLPAGEYRVKAYGIEKTFTFEQDNAIPE